MSRSVAIGFKRHKRDVVSVNKAAPAWGKRWGRVLGEDMTRRRGAPQGVNNSISIRAGSFQAARAKAGR